MRTAVAAITATVFGATGHLLAGGTVSPVVLAAALVTAAVPAWLLAGRERSWAGIAALQVAQRYASYTRRSRAAAPGTPRLR